MVFAISTTEVQISIGSKIFIFPEPQVDDTGIALGIKFGRWVGDDFNGFNVCRGQPFLADWPILRDSG
ncbi:MAG: hypothetical protein IPO65_11525 [Saprospiraceae bacterium]|nr:hypothetical protein [Saprospiraceae bacterium]